MNDRVERSFVPASAGAQMNEQAKEVKRQVMNLIDDITLRKWACEQAIKGVASDVEYNAKFFYNFAINKEKSDDKAS